VDFGSRHRRIEKRHQPGRAPCTVRPRGVNRHLPYRWEDTDLVVDSEDGSPLHPDTSWPAGSGSSDRRGSPTSDSTTSATGTPP
jgi:hypothetical protein